MTREESKFLKDEGIARAKPVYFKLVGWFVLICLAGILGTSLTNIPRNRVNIMMCEKLATLDEQFMEAHSELFPDGIPDHETIYKDEIQVNGKMPPRAFDHLYEDQDLKDFKAQRNNIKNSYDRIQAMVSLGRHAVSMLIAIFILAPMNVGYSKATLELRDDTADITGRLWYAFREGRYWKSVKGLAVVSSVIYLPLMVDDLQEMSGVPGLGTLFLPLTVLAFYFCFFECAMAYLIVAEETEEDSLSSMEVVKRSMAMMKGNKKNLLDLVFAYSAFFILIFVFCGIPIIFFAPYIRCSETYFYECIKEQAAKEGQSFIPRQPASEVYDEGAGAGAQYEGQPQYGSQPQYEAPVYTEPEYGAEPRESSEE